MGDRKLATVRIVKAIEKIEGADVIELVLIDGWQCVAKKGEMYVGDKVVYFEVDSFLPIKSEFEFLRKSSYRKLEFSEGFRLRTVRFLGRLSQGLALPFSELNLDVDNFNVGDDLTDLLEVTLYETPVPADLEGTVLAAYPIYIPKSNQERIQNLMDYIERYKDMLFEATIKLNGTSGTYYFNNGYFGVCGHRMEYLDTPENTFWNVAKRLRIQDILTMYNRNIALQGELMGPGIQKNKEKLKQHNFFVYDIYDIDNHQFFAPSERLRVLCALNIIGSDEKEKIEHVPVIASACAYFSIHKTLEDILESAKGRSLNSESREGIILKSMEEGVDRISFKILNNDYLLKEKD